MIDPERLTPREREVLALFAQGLIDREIAARLELGRETVTTHIRRIKHRLGLPDRAALWAAIHTVSLGSLEEGQQ